MVMLVAERELEEQLKAQRREAGSDRFDELEAAQLQLAGRSTLAAQTQLQSTVLPLNFRLVPGDVRPIIEIAHNDGRQAWSV